MGFAHILSSNGNDLEFYAHMWDEYGFRLKLGRNKEGQVYS